MRITIATTSYPDGVPGSEAAGAFVADFANELAKHAAVRVVAVATRDGESREGDVQVTRFAVPRTPLSLLRPLNPGDWPAILRTLRAGGKAMRRVVDEQQPDHVLALWALPTGYWARAACARSNVPYSVWALGSDIWSLGRLPVLRTVLRRVLRDAHTCFADGLQLAKDVAQISGRGCDFMASSRRLPGPNVASVASAPPYRLAFLGRWHRNKGIDVLLDALEGLGDSEWQKIAAVRICGGGPLHDQVNRRGAELAGRGRPVEIGGFLDADAAAELIGWADYLLLPSRIESIPVVFSDAMQAGTPMIATPVGDLPRLFERYEVGMLADDVSASGLQRAIISALDTDVSNYAAGVKTAASDFDVASTAQRFAQRVAGANG